jgi:hypothetical protein
MTIQIKKKLEDEIRILEYELKNDLPKELKKAAALTNVKLGALPVRRARQAGQTGAPPPLSSEEIAAAWRPFFEVCVDRFGAKRCMFESNFPVQKRWCSYAVLWNACKRLAAGCSVSEKSALFVGTAARVYRVPASTT